MLSTIYGGPKVTVYLQYTRSNGFIPSINIHKLAEQMGMLYGSAHMALTRHMHLQPYKTT
jgi:hypothetical protein